VSETPPEAPAPVAPLPLGVDPGATEQVRTTARLTLAALPGQLDAAMNAIRLTKAQIDLWGPEFWAACGYTQSATTATLEHLEALAASYDAEYQQDAASLTQQAPLP
jgi:hypothetical protein